MAKFGIIIPIRSDLAGMGLQVEDVTPNTSQKNSVYDGEGQSGYIGEMCDLAGATVFAGEAYSSGSRMTTASSLVANFALDNTADLIGGGAESSVTQVPQMGLAAYLRERVVNDPTGAGDTLAAADADAIAAALILRVANGQVMNSAAIDSAIQAVTGAPGGGGDGTEILAGNAADEFSFGKVSDVLRIIAGEAYIVPSNCVIADNAGAFLPLSHPNGAGEVAGGAVQTRRGRIENLSAAAAALDPVPVATGHFLEDGDAGYVGKRLQAMGAGLAASASAGKLRSLHDNAIVVENPAFAYIAADVTAVRPLAVAINDDGAGSAAIGAGGSAIALRVYDSEGELLNLP